ncbi:hypothetical protein HaLaN_20003 [Haematococcus lacustris]|uniref:Uncharacterized protein n=1 Tax=Haematococcus lacustris TaxID=44745 RepID=A0A699ZIF4_HAELA|nr:hypothetical protein HaLaN_20003 [Haematococcus lacustris]
MHGAGGWVKQSKVVGPERQTRAGCFWLTDSVTCVVRLPHLVQLLDVLTHLLQSSILVLTRCQHQLVQLVISWGSFCTQIYIKIRGQDEKCARNGLRFSVRPLLTSTPHSTSRKSSASHCARPARLLAMFHFEWSGRPVNQQPSQIKSLKPFAPALDEHDTGWSIILK